MSKRTRVFWTGMAIAAYCVVMSLIFRVSDKSARLGLAVIAAQLLAAAMLLIWVSGTPRQTLR